MDPFKEPFEMKSSFSEKQTAYKKQLHKAIKKQLHKAIRNADPTGAHKCCS